MQLSVKARLLAEVETTNSPVTAVILEDGKNFSGLAFMMLLIPTDASGMEVRIPKTKKETANEDILSFFERSSTEETISPAPNQIATNDKIYKEKSRTIQ